MILTGTRSADAERSKMKPSHFLSIRDKLSENIVQVLFTGMQGTFEQLGLGWNDQRA